MIIRRATLVALAAIAPIGGCGTEDHGVAYYDGYYNAYAYDDYVYDSTTLGYGYYGYYDPIWYYSLSGGPALDRNASSQDRLQGFGAEGEEDASTLPAPLHALLNAFGTSVSEACVTPSSSSADADGDGIPATYTATLQCTSEEGSTASGTVKLTDTDDSAKDSGFTLTFDTLRLKGQGIGGGSRSRTLRGKLTLSPKAASGGSPATYTLTRDLTVDFNDVRANGATVQGTYVTQASSSYTPDDAANPFDAGTLSATGETHLTSTGDNGGSERTLTRSTEPPLHWRRSCLQQAHEKTGFDSGTLVLRDDQGNVLRVTYSGCGRPSLKYEPGDK